ncbi:probable disease resistance protein At1g59620, partial [Capsella rubella]
MAETLLSFGVEKLWELLVRESERFKGVDEQFNELKSDLNMLRCFLKDADAKKHTSAMVGNIVKEIKEIVYDTEDIIETFLLKQKLGGKSGIRNHARRLSSAIVERRGIAFDMGAISKRIAKVIRDMQSLGVQHVIVSDEYMKSLQERHREMRQTFANDNESVLVGFEKNVRKLVSYMVEKDSSQVVSITGMGGLGKTTLARQVINHETIKCHFAGLAWVCVSQQFTRKYVWQTILRKLRPAYNVSQMTEDELQENLVRVLETQKALIVLDDIWKEEDWDRIKPIFPPAKGWKVLLTSRNEGVALRADPTCFTFKPECLTLTESWTLFRSLAFARENTTEYKLDEDMEEMGKQMMKHCGGLPLAVKVLGGLLAAQKTLTEWKRIYENIRSHIVGGTSFSDRSISSIYHILNMSFEELPIYLKQCFLYLTHFPEDYPIDVGKLSYYWAAEGIPKPRNYDGATIREVADGYVGELVKRNMLISERDTNTLIFETCRLHDMMREVCLLKAEEENFLQVVDASTFTSPAVSSQSPCISRRLGIHSFGDTTHMECFMNNPKLRSFLIIKNGIRGSEWWTAPALSFTRLQLMRVLDLSRVEFEGEKLPSNIGNLIHLRYLSLYMAKVSHLPSSMQNLKLLLYLNLNVKAGHPLSVPNILKEMQELRYLWLPGKIHDKAKLELGDLVNLETLENFSTKHSNVRDLDRMTRLTTLSILFDGGTTMETLSSYLGALTRLENLSISGHMVDTNEYYMDVFRCLEKDPMPLLEKPPESKEVVSVGERCICERRLVCSGGGFAQLRKLYLRGIDEWEEWIVKEGSMPLLHTLFISHCNNLRELPDGMRFITSLKELEIVTSDRRFKEKLYRGREDYYKIQHIPLLKIP